MIIILVNGGALLDYRTREGLTPVHKAAATGQAASVKVHCNMEFLAFNATCFPSYLPHIKQNITGGTEMPSKEKHINKLLYMYSCYKC